MLERLYAMLVKEFIQLFRDPRMTRILFVVPVFQTLMFGYAVTMDVKNVELAVVDHDRSELSRDFLASFAGSPYFTAMRYVDAADEAQALIDAGEVRLALVIPAGFAGDWRAGRAATLQLIADGSDASFSGKALQYATAIAAGWWRARSGAPPDPVIMAARAWFNANLDSRNFYLPGVVAMLVMVIALLLSSMAVVRERELGTIEQVMVTPIGRTEFIIGKTLPFALVSLATVTLVIIVAVGWFRVPLRGSVALLFAGTLLYLTAMLGIGLLISTVSETQQQAMMTAFFFIFPGMLLSGFVFPIFNMPEVVQWLTYANPLRYFLIIVRSIFLKGSGFAILWPQFAGLAALGLVFLGLAIARLHKTTG
ncbi:MAG TPA: ABC transporter permease [bacterium]|nr:ABC transporter permease [bacterium]